MCGIAGAIRQATAPIPNLERRLAVMNDLLRHRGPDGPSTWMHDRQHVGFAHRRLSIIDLETGQQPMGDGGGNWITYNGEIYNYLELRDELGADRFVTTSDTEVILHAYRKWGPDCLNHLRGMFAFALWDEARHMLFCARDRFGIKPFYYTMVGDTFYFASEVKAIVPFMDGIDTDLEGFKDYLTFQFCLAGKTLFAHVHELLPGHMLWVGQGALKTQRYWEVYYDLDFDRTDKYFEDRLRTLLTESVDLHMRSDVPVGAYVSGGLDSGIVASLASRHERGDFVGFTGKFAYGPDYDESAYARELSTACGFPLYEVAIGAGDFIEHIRKVIYHLDYPVAGPGAFPQYMVSQLAAEHRKVVLGGQGGDEIFGGYVRYLIAYFEQCIKAAIDGTAQNGNFIVTYESIIPNLTALQKYKPMLQDFWREGLFDSMDRRYFRLIDRGLTLTDEIYWDCLDHYSPFDTFQTIFSGHNVGRESYFDLMTHFDFKTLLPALLHVEDRVSMAHSLESRVPLLDHPLIELAATMPSNIKFKDGTMKHVLRSAMRAVLPDSIAQRQDKMGFPVPLSEWISGEAYDFLYDIFSSQRARTRDLTNTKRIRDNLTHEPKFGRKIWGLLCLELWQQEFHDKAPEFRRRLVS